jgi:hypothetical protein
LYEKESNGLEPWKDSPGEVVGLDWKDYLGKKEFVNPFSMLIQLLLTIN